MAKKSLPRQYRIAYCNDWHMAYRDRDAFNLWAKRQISAEHGARLLSKNNRTPVTRAQFIANAIWLEYTRK